MKFKLDALHMTLLAALGLDLGCAVRPLGSEADSEGSGTGDGDGDAVDGDGDAGDGDGDPETGDGDGDVPEPPDPFACENPQPILQPDSGLPSGFVTCDGGFIHREEKVEPSDPQGPDDEACALDEFSSCNTADDCVGDSYGRCIQDPLNGCMCDYGCASDADCNPSEICAPSGVVGSRSTCITAECTIDDECGEGLCGLSEYDGCCGVWYMTACADPDEACHVDSECPDAPCSPEFPERGIVEYQCTYQSDFAPADGDWTCEPPGWCNCDCGRPFFVDGDARVAPTLARADWCDSLAMLAMPAMPVRQLAALDPATRARLVEHWTQIARFEHASVASFARFGLQLLQLGAPPKLLRQSSRALADEIEHARLAFGLASAYADAPIGPGGLDVAAAIEPKLDLHAILEGLIVEACVGETLAAIEAHEAARWAEDLTVAAILERIAEDEWRHAQLGWRALGWVLAQGDERLRGFALSCFELALAAIEGNRAVDVDPELRRHGVLDAALRDEVRRAGIAAVIRPCIAALRAVKDKECVAVGTAA